MATIEIDKREFEELTGRKFSDDELIEEASFLGAHWHSIDGNVCEVETYPDRPDLLSVEGLARAYRGFFDIEKGRERYEVYEGDIEVEKNASVEEVRPHIGGAVIRNVELSEKVINGLIQLQEKLHETMGRKRDKLAIGLHDLAHVEPPFSYRAVEPEQVSFTPLEHEENMQLGEILEEHEKGREYSWILDEEELYPIIEDKDGKVLSFPPIINNQLTEVETGTEDLFIDVTGKESSAVMKALNIIVTALSERGGQIESVEVNGERMPQLEPETMELEPDYLREVSGLDLKDTEIMEKLEMMKFGCNAGDAIEVEVPCYRNDVMHQYDLIEDVIIAHRYRNIEPKVPEIDTAGASTEMNDLVQVLRDIMTGTGAMEAMTYIHENRKKIEQLEMGDYVKVENPVSEEYSALRNTMVPSLLDVLKVNKHREYPQEFFEASKVVEIDGSATGASNAERLAYICSGSGKGFTDAREILQVVERDLRLEIEIEDRKIPFFDSARSGKIYIEGEESGFIGQFDGDVLKDWEIDMPTAGFELNLNIVLEKLRDN